MISLEGFQFTEFLIILITHDQNIIIVGAIQCRSNNTVVLTKIDSTENKIGKVCTCHVEGNAQNFRQ